MLTHCSTQKLTHTYIFNVKVKFRDRIIYVNATKSKNYNYTLQNFKKYNKKIYKR